MKRRLYLFLAVSLLAVTATVPAVTFAWLDDRHDYALELRSGESVAIINAKAFRRRLNPEADLSYGYENLAAEVTGNNSSDSEGTIAIKLKGLEFMPSAELFDSVVSDSLINYNAFPRLFLEIDIVKEYFDAFLVCDLTGIGLKRGETPLTDELFEYKYFYHENDPADPKVDAIEKAGILLDRHYSVSESGQTDGVSVLTDGLMLTDGKIGATSVSDKAPYSVVRTEADALAQLSVRGFSEKPTDTTGTTGPVFSRAIILSIGINPKRYLKLAHEKPELVRDKATFSLSLTFDMNLSNTKFAEPEAEI